MRQCKRIRKLTEGTGSRSALTLLSATSFSAGQRSRGRVDHGKGLSHLEEGELSRGATHRTGPARHSLFRVHVVSDLI